MKGVYKIDSFRFRKLARRKAMKGGGRSFLFYSRQHRSYQHSPHTRQNFEAGGVIFWKSSKALYYETFFTSILETSDRSGLLCCAGTTAVFSNFAPVGR